MGISFDGLGRLLVAAAVIAGLSSCGKSSPDSSRQPTESRAYAHQAVSSTSLGHKTAAVEHAGQNQLETSSLLDPAREDPDPRVRLHAIETWAAKPGKALDPVTYALVDPDESVRARAQELFEEALERNSK